MKLKNYLEILAIMKKSPPCAKIIFELYRNASVYVNADAATMHRVSCDIAVIGCNSHIKDTQRQ